MEIAGIFYSHLEYFTVLWYILWPFGNVMEIWYIFPRFGILCQEKSGNPGAEAGLKMFLGSELLELSELAFQDVGNNECTACKFRPRNRIENRGQSYKR
jgi:hypothetical protein